MAEEHMKASIPDRLKRLDTPRNRKRGIWAGALFAGIGVIGFLALPPLVRWQAEEQLSKLLHRKVNIEAVRINPYALSATVEGLRVADKDDPEQTFVAFDRLYANLEAQSVFRGGPVLKELQLVKPVVHITRYDAHRYNFTDLAEEFLNKPDDGSKSSFSLNNIQISGGELVFEDKPMAARHVVSELSLGVPFVSNLPSKVDIFVEPAFSARVNGAPVELAGKARPFAENRDALIDVHLSDVDLTRYFPYVPTPLGFRLPSGKLETRLAVNFQQPHDGAPRLLVSGSAGLLGVATANPAGDPLVKFERLDVAIKSLDVFGRQLELERVSLLQPDVHVARAADGSLNLKAFAASATGGEATAQAPAPAPQPAAPWVVRVAETVIDKGRVSIADATPKARPFTTVVNNLALRLKQLSTEPGKTAELDLALETEAKEQIKLAGGLGLAPVALDLDVDWSALKVRQYEPFFADQVLLDVIDGALSGKTKLKLALPESGLQLTVSGLESTLEGLKLRQRGAREDLLSAGRLALKGGEVDLAQRAVSLGEVLLSQTKVAVKRDKSGQINLAQLVPPAPPGKSAPAAKPQTPEPAWQVNVKRLATEGSSVLFEDLSNTAPVKLNLDAIALQVDNFSTAKGNKSQLNLRLTPGRKGSLAVSGPLVLEPLATSLKIEAKDVDILPAQPYFTDKVNITLLKGSALARGQLSLEQAAGGELKGSFKGDLGTNDLHAIDKANAADLLKWKSLFVGGINARLAPFGLDVDQVALSDFYSRLIVSPEGKLNLQQLVKQGPEAATAPAKAPPATNPATRTTTAPVNTTKATPPPPIQIKQVTLQGGNINFSDFFIKPNYSANLTKVGGRVTGLSSSEGTAGEVDLRGQLDGAAPVEITGRLNPLAKQLFVDIKASARAIELSNFSPYSGKYVGYGIEKGKLSVNVAYKVENQQLSAQNNIFLDQLTFGEKIESPDAIKAPVLLAVSLLKNRRGEIDINLPISGSLDDPQFSVGSIIVKVIVNLVTKAVTAPFALLGSMFGGGEDLGYVEFEPGRAALAPAARDKLQTLAKALDDRPALRLEVTGRIDPDNDGEGVKRASLDRKIRAAKVGEQARNNEATESADEVLVAPGEYAKLLAQVYKAEKFPKPRNAIGLAKDLPVPEMEKLILANTKVGEEDLHQLAQQRAQTVKEFLLQQGKVAPERVFIVAGKGGDDAGKAAEKDGKAKASRADFSLK